MGSSLLLPCVSSIFGLRFKFCFSDNFPFLCGKYYYPQDIYTIRNSLRIGCIKC